MKNFSFRPGNGVAQLKAEVTPEPAKLLRGDAVSFPLNSCAGAASAKPADATTQPPAAGPDAGAAQEPKKSEPAAEAAAPVSVPATASASSAADAAAGKACWEHPDLAIFASPAMPEPVLEEFFGGLIDEELRSLAREVGVPYAVPMASFAAILGGVIGHRAAAEMGPTWHEPAVVWFFLIADSGSHKSATARYYVEVVRGLELQEAADWNAHLKNVDQHNLVVDIRMRDYRRSMEAAVRAGALSLPLPPDIEPIDLVSRNPPQIIVDDVTLPALTAAHAHPWNISGLLALPDEAAPLFDRIARRSDLRAALLRAHDGGRYRADRLTRAQIDISRFAVSILGSGVPGGLTLGDVADGFSARILWIAYENEDDPPLPNSGLQTPATQDALRRARQLVRDSKDQLRLPLAAMARERFEIVAGELRGRGGRGQSHIASWYARAPSHVLRLAVLREVCLAAHAGAAPVEIGLASIEAAAAAVAGFFGPMAQRVLGAPAAAYKDKITQLAEAIATHAAATADGRLVINRRKFRQKVGAGLAAGPIYYPLWNALEHAGLLREVPRADGVLGRTLGDYEVNPVLAAR